MSGVGSGFVVPEPEIGTGGGGGAGDPCTCRDHRYVKGHYMLVKECRHESGLFYELVSEGDCKITTATDISFRAGTFFSVTAEELALLQVGETLVEASPERVYVRVGDATIVATADHVVASVGPASTETTAQHVAVTLGAAQLETTQDRIEANVGATTRLTATDERIEAVAHVLSAVILLPAADAIPANRFVTLTAAGVAIAGPTSGVVIGSTMEATAGGGQLVRVRLNGIPFEVEASAAIARADFVEIDADGFVIPWVARQDAPPQRGVALNPAAPGAIALLIKI